MSDTPKPETRKEEKAPAQTETSKVDFGNPFDEEKVLLEWSSPERVHKPRGRDFYTTVSAFVVLFSIIALFFKEFLLMVTIWAFAFLSVVMSRTQPQLTRHRITNRGIRTGTNKYSWGELARFWFDEKWGQQLLHVDTFRPFPGRIVLVIGEITNEKVKEILVKRIPYDKPDDTFVDRAAKWLQEKVPLEEDHPTRVPATPSGK